MTFRNVQLAFGMVGLLAACVQQPDSDTLQPVPGVSGMLAIHRKALLSRIQYVLTLDIPKAIDQPIAATEQISFQLAKTGSDLQLDFKESSEHLKTLSVNGKTAKIDYRQEHLVIPADLLVKGMNRLRIELTAGDLSLNRNDEFLYSLFVPDRMRTFVPCFDQPDLKAIFTLTASVPANWEVVTNGKLRDKLIHEDRATYHFGASDTISTYLFSVVAGKFQHISRKIRNREMNLYYRETDTAKVGQSLDSIFELLWKSLEFMEAYTEIPYPFKKFDIVAIPDFTYGGMEHAGAIDYRAATLFLDRAATQDQRNDRANTIAHETAHMWFGNLVTMQWFNDVWMKEVFANFMADKINAGLLPDPGNDFRFLLNHHPAAYGVDRTEGANPIRQPLDNLNQAGMLYGAIIYQKAPVAMRQLEQTCGAEILRKGLREYLKKYAFRNASWPQLIEILDRLSTENLDSWNTQWINRSGMPVFSYSLKTDGGKVSRFVLEQRIDKRPGVCPQHFNVALVYKDRIQLLPVNMDRTEVVLKAAEGLENPSYIILNATGEGYGAFPVDVRMFAESRALLSPVMRASVSLNMYEQVMEGKTFSPRDFLQLCGRNFSTETEELILNRMTRQFRNIYWQFIRPEAREALAAELAPEIWKALEKSSSAGKKRLLFLTYLSIASGKLAINRIYEIWKSEKAPAGILLSEDDYLSMAAELVIRQHPKSKEILAIQSQRIKDADRRLKFAFLQPALSNEVAVRDAFFASLAFEKNRAKEVWVSEALGYLHHPLRHSTSEKYLPQTLEWLEDVQKTGDIFFPSDWLRASLGSYQSKNAERIVRGFLEKNPNYNSHLRRKILQEADDLFRAQRLFALDK